MRDSYRGGMVKAFAILAVALVMSGSTGASADEQAAREAALRATGGGTVNEVERDSEDGATWEVEVTKPDGKTVDVRLDGELAVVVIEADSE